MNDNETKNSENITPYRASGNLNTAISNPKVNINDTMNVNIQSMATNEVPLNGSNVGSTSINNSAISSIPNIPNQNLPSNMPSANNINNNTSVNINTQSGNYNSSNNINTVGNSNVKRTYVTNDNKPRKKKISLNIGSEFKIALLIVVILLVFIFILPMITDLFKAH